MYKKQGTSSTLSEILAKIKQTDSPASYTYNAEYAPADITKAKAVLDRILRVTQRREETTDTATAET